MANVECLTKTELYQKIKKPLLERQRRARINKCLDELKQLMVDLSGNGNIVRMDKAEMLETTMVYLRQRVREPKVVAKQMPMDSFRYGYMNAVNEVSRVLASVPGMTVEMGKSVMKHLGRSYNSLQQQYEQREQQIQPLTIDCPVSPASSGYQSDEDSPEAFPIVTSAQMWRPW